MAEKRRSSAETRTRILAAAQEVFAEHGYAAASTREVARRAGSNITLIARYFGSKKGLFEEAVAKLLEVSPIVSAAPGQFSDAVLRQVAHGEAKAVPSTRILAMSLGDEASRRISADLLQANALEPLARWLGGAGPDPLARLILALSLGVTAYRILFGDQEDFLADPRVEALFRSWIDQAVEVARQEAGPG
jgi:AcrR family transcriptional regulator